MGTVLEKANEIKKTKNKLKEAINNGGGQITDNTIFNDYANEIKDIYIDAINDGVDNLYNNFPKITGEGSEITLDTEEAPMKITLEGNTSQKTSILPKEYTQIDYIQSSGTQYIDTNYYCNPNTKIEIEFKQDYIKNLSYPIFGNGDEEENGLAISLSNQSGLNSYRIYCGDDYPASQNIPLTPDTNKHLFVLDLKNEIIKIDSNSYNMLPQTTNPRTNNSINSLLIFANRDFDGSVLNLKSRGRLYSAKIYNNNILVRDIIPCYRNSDNEVGMYDLVTDTFYTNQGTGVFTYGSVIQISNPDYPQDIKVVTGEQSIKIHNKNLFDTNNLVQGYISDTIMDNRTNTTRTNAILLKAGTYTYSFKCTNSTWIKMVKYANVTATTGTFIFNLQSANYSKTFTLSEDTYVRLGFDIKLSNILANATIQIEFGPTASDCVEHQSQTYQLSLGNIELAKIGNYKDYIFKNVTDSPYYNANLDLNDWYLHKEIIGENLWEKAWVYESESSTPVPRTVLRLSNMPSRGSYFSNCFLSSEMNNSQIPNRLKTDTSNWYIALADSLTGVETTDSNNTKANKITTFLQSISANIYYGLITPTNTKITDTTLISQLENMNNNAKSYLGTTIIECSSIDNTNEAIQASTIALKNIDLIESE